MGVGVKHGQKDVRGNTNGIGGGVELVKETLVPGDDRGVKDTVKLFKEALDSSAVLGNIKKRLEIGRSGLLANGSALRVVSTGNVLNNLLRDNAEELPQGREHGWPPGLDEIT